MLQSHRYHGGLPLVTEAETKQLQTVDAILEELEAGWHENTMRFTGGEPV